MPEMADRRAIACPKCGGPLDEDANANVTTCRFCGVAVAPAPREVERVVERIVVVPGQANAAGDANALRCPRCGHALEGVRSAAKTVDVCTRCGGVWVDAETSDYLARVSDPDLETAVRRAIGVVMSVPPNVRQMAVSCPVCGQATRRIEIPNTVNCIDRCEAHGTWFDRDELRMFVEAQRDARAGDVSEADIPVEKGFFTRVFGSLFGQ